MDPTLLLLLASSPSQSPISAAIRIEAARPVAQRGSRGEDRKGASHYGHVLGNEWGGSVGDFAEYRFVASEMLMKARLLVRYARELEGASKLDVFVDGRRVGTFELQPTGGWGDRDDQFRVADIGLPSLAAGTHRLRFVVPSFKPPVAVPKLSPVSVLERVGGRTDKNTVGHGRNVALYTGRPSRFFYATEDLTDVFSAVDGVTLDWAPDHVVVTPNGNPPANANLDEIQIDEGPLTDRSEPYDPTYEQRQVCVTEDDVIVSKIEVTNLESSPIRRHVEVRGDCRESRDYRGRPGERKATARDGDMVVVTDRNAFPSVLPHGLAIVVGGNRKPDEIDTATPGAYRLGYDLDLPPNGRVSFVVACAIQPDVTKAKVALRRTLATQDPLESNRRSWQRFYEREVPSFTSSDRGLDELYAFRWFLLRFSRAGGNLGFLRYPVVLEGRQAFQTYCCYSAPFMAFDLNWAVDPTEGYGQLANMRKAAYPDGRFPWYTTPQTNRVPLDHPSATGQSALPWAAWRFYEVHRRKDLLASLYPTMRANVDWWIRDRDPDGNGLFSIEHQLETGMDDLHRRWIGKNPKRYEAIDATAYTILNLRAVANMARVLGNGMDAEKYGAYADRASKAMQGILWDPTLERYRDRSPETGERTDYNSITIFYPLYAGVAGKENLGLIPRYLLNPAEYATPWPVPALSRSDIEFDTEHRYWAGPTWPATNSHVVQGFIETAKRLDRSRLPEAAALFRRVAALHLRPRADFYEHYNSLTGAPMSSFRDYMHSWWVDIVVRHVAGLTPRQDGGLSIDPIPLGLRHYELRGAPYAGHRVDVLYSPEALTVKIDGKTVRKVAGFRPGGRPIEIPARTLERSLGKR